MTFHVNPKTGNPGRCSARNGNCPFGNAEEHYATKEQAREAFEAKNIEEVTVSHKKTIVLSDVDGTLVRSSFVLENAVELHDKGLLNLGSAPDRWRADMKNEDLIRELADEYRGALAGRTMGFVRAKQTVERLLASEENFYSTLQQLIEHKKAGNEVVLISGSPDFLIGPFAERFGFKYHASSYHQDERGRFTGEITLLAGAAAKQAVIDDLGIHEYDEVIGLGDTASDTPLLSASHKSILVDPSEETIAKMKSNNVRIDEIVRH